LIELVKPGTQIDFLGARRTCLVVSLAVIVLGLLAIPVRGFRTGIDFAGGTEIQIRFLGDEAVGEGGIRDVLGDLDIGGASVIRYGAGESQEFLVKLPGRLGLPGAAAGASGSAPDELEAVPDAAAEPAADASATSPKERVEFFRGLETALTEKLGPMEIARVEFVGPKVGAELRRDGILALAIACLLILIYIGFRFSLRFAPGAVVALIHDVLITSGVWVLLGLEFDLRVLAALLAIVGYSLNDTIIVYDRVRENMELRTKQNLEEVLNLSVNQTLSRTLLTSMTTLLAVLALFFLGGPVIEPFALAMAIGVVVGTYSSIYIAAPTLLWLERRFGGAPAAG
jgi:preprotein translocase subunit SecF